MPEVLGQFGGVIERGGPVMIPLLVLSVVGLALVVERAWFWLGVHRPARAASFHELVTALRTGRRDLAASLARRDRGPYGQVAERLLADGTGDGTALEAVEAVRPRLERFLVTLSAIVTAAPLIGILGTVVGIIDSFELLGESQAVRDPGAVAAGIATALVTTAGGLVVALLVLFPYLVFRGQSDRALGRLEALVASAREGLAGTSAGVPAPVRPAVAPPRSAPAAAGPESAGVKPAATISE